MDREKRLLVALMERQVPGSACRWDFPSPKSSSLCQHKIGLMKMRCCSSNKLSIQVVLLAVVRPAQDCNEHCGIAFLQER